MRGKVPRLEGTGNNNGGFLTAEVKNTPGISSGPTPTLGDELHRGPAHEDLAVKPLTP